jgi:hypothetical protein
VTNPRTWTFLSDFIVKNYGKNSSFNDYYQEISEIGSSYINLPDLLEFLRFTKERYLITYEDILNNKNNIVSKERIKSLDRDVSSRILNELKELNVNDFSKKQINKLVNFLNLLEAEQKISYLYDLLSDIKYDNIDYKEDRKSNLTYIIEVFDKEKEIIFNKIPEIS